jgi:hypothetical protein
LQQFFCRGEVCSWGRCDVHYAARSIIQFSFILIGINDKTQNSLKTCRTKQGRLDFRSFFKCPYLKSWKSCMQEVNFVSPKK